MRITNRLQTDDSGSCSTRKIYICWLPGASEEANEWVDKLFRFLEPVRQDANSVPVVTVRLENRAGETAATENQACREGITDFVFVATSFQITEQTERVNTEKNSDLKWVLDLQGDETAPRVWLIPLESFMPSWFEFPPELNPQKFLSDYFWHLPIPSELIVSGNPGDADIELDEIDINDRTKISKVRSDLLKHAVSTCKVCQ